MFEISMKGENPKVSVRPLLKDVPYLFCLLITYEGTYPDENEIVTSTYNPSVIVSTEFTVYVVVVTFPDTTVLDVTLDIFVPAATTVLYVAANLAIFTVDSDTVYAPPDKLTDTPLPATTVIELPPTPNPVTNCGSPSVQLQPASQSASFSIIAT